MSPHTFYFFLIVLLPSFSHSQNLTSPIFLSAPLFDYYIANTKAFYSNLTGPPCISNSSRSGSNIDCRSLLVPGTTVDIQWLQLYFPPDATASARIKAEYICSFNIETVEIITDITGSSISTPFIVPGKGVNPNSGDIYCKANLHNIIDFEVCLFQKNTNLTQSFDQVTSRFIDYSLLMSCVQTYAYLDVPRQIQIQSASKLISYNEYSLADIFAAIFAGIAFIWLSISFYNYRRRRGIYDKIGEKLEREESTAEYDMLQKEMLVNAVNRNLENTELRTATFASDDFYCRPAQSRIDKLGRYGYGYRMFSFLLSWRVLNVANSTLVVSSDGKLHLLPKFFTIKMTFRVALQFLFLVSMLLGYLFYRFGSGVYLPGSFGVYGMLGGVIFGLLFLTLSPHPYPFEKGMLKLLRSVGEPKVPEIMFSYNWGYCKNDIRTLAQALWNSGLGVWIDALKLTSGDKLELDIRRAAREVNYIVVFLTPNYVRSRNCQIEFEVAKQNLAKLHVHVLLWDSSVGLVLKHLIDDLHFPQSRITSHGQGLVISRFSEWFGRNKPTMPSLPVLDDENSTDTDRFITDLEKNGKGWIQLTAVLHNYSKRAGNSWDFGWWLTNTQSGGGIPDTAPCPPNIEKWNLRPFYPFGKWPSLPTWEELRLRHGRLKIGNVYITADCRRTGSDGSAIPWKFPIFLIASILPLFDLVSFITQENSLQQYTAACVNDVKSALAKNITALTAAICSRFFETTLYVGNGDALSHSAYRYTYVNEAFSSLVPLVNCNWTVWKNPVAISDVVPCTFELTTWFSDSTKYFPNRIVWVIICIMSLTYLFTIITNIEKIVDTTYNIASPLRPLLAVASFEKDPAKPAFSVKIKRKHKNAMKYVAQSSKKLGGDDDSEYELMDQLDHNDGNRNSGEIVVKLPQVPPIPSLYVRVHGKGLIAENLQTFLTNIGRHLPWQIGCPNLFETPTGTEIPTIQNTMLLNGESYAWVNLFVVSTVEDMNLFYKANVEEKLDLEISVVIVDHSPITEKLTYAQLSNKEWNLLRSGAETTDWIHSVVYIETRYREEKKKFFDAKFFGIWKKFHDPVNYLEDAPNDELARQIMLVLYFS
ncbi:hypothetical protein HK098_003081 [Nowakowskiella sp. JEL0407]|nr:hypothetical protein HK098_003081 [Nowakowskiella sp. JEL0407]